MKNTLRSNRNGGISISPTVHKTRFTELGFIHLGRNLWKIVDITENPDGNVVGPFYRTRAELLGDLTRYATEEFGV